MATAVNPGIVASDIWRATYALPIFGTLFHSFCSSLAHTVEQGAAFSAAAAVAPRPADKEAGLYLQSYYLPLGLAPPLRDDWSLRRAPSGSLSPVG